MCWKWYLYAVSAVILAKSFSSPGYVKVSLLFIEMLLFIFLIWVHFKL